MLRKRETPAFDQIDTLIGAGTMFRGVVTASGTVRIDGGLEGEVRTKGEIVIGESGKVEGSLEGRNVLVAGQLKGNIMAIGKTEVAATGRIFGDLKVGSLVIDDGAVFQGNCQMEGTHKLTDGQKDLKLDGHRKTQVL